MKSLQPHVTLQIVDTLLWDGEWLGTLGKLDAQIPHPLLQDNP